MIDDTPFHPLTSSFGISSLNLQQISNIYSIMANNPKVLAGTLSVADTYLLLYYSGSWLLYRLGANGSYTLEQSGTGSFVTWLANNAQGYSESSVDLEIYVLYSSVPVSVQQHLL